MLKPIQTLALAALGLLTGFLPIRATAESAIFPVERFNSLNVSQLVAYEYWFDYTGQPVFVPVSPTEELQLGIGLPTDGLSAGLHTLHIRFLDDQGVWSSVLSQFFIKTPPAQGGERQITAYQYWYDNDFAAVVEVPVSPAAEVTVLNNLPTDGLTNGLHTLHLRFKDDIGQWTSVLSQFFIKTPPAQGGERQIVAYQYWFDNAAASAVEVPVSPVAEVTVLNNLPTDGLTNGLHTLHLRFKDDIGQWTSVLSQFFIKTPPAQGGERQIVAYQYWFDNAAASAVEVPVSPVAEVTVLNNLPTDGLTNGLHTLHLRFKDDIGQWTSVLSQFFIKTPPAQGGERQIVAYQYWFDNAAAAAVEVPVSPAAEVTVLNNLPTDGLTNGLHTLHLRFRDDIGQWSSVLSQFFIKSPLAQGGERQIVAYQYWFNDASAEAMDVPVNPAAEVIVVSDLPTGGLPVGIHTLHVRFRDDTGVWSGVLSETFSVPPGSPRTFYADADGDTYGDPAVTIVDVNPPPGYVEDNTDCDDTNSNINPGVPEICNGVDDNCDGATDEGLIQTFYPDADADGYGNADSPIVGCFPPPGYTANNTDCDDTNPNVHPGAPETCNGIDDNCNGQIDEGVLVYFFADEDGDGYGDPNVFTVGCTAPANYVVDSTDCDDSNELVHSGVDEICNGIDDNCDGIIDFPVSIMPIDPGVCEGNEVTISVSGGTNYLWSTGQTTGSITVSPTSATVYTVTVTNTNVQCTVTTSVTVQHMGQPAAPFNFFPANGTPDISPNNIMFSWAPAPNATAYDFFIWKQGDNQPSQPSVADISQINLYYSIPNPEFGATYHWKIIAKNPYCSTDGPVVSFALLNLPDLTIQNIQAPASAFTGQNLTISWEVKNRAAGSTNMAQWHDAIYLSADDVLDTNVDLYLGAVPNFSALILNQSYSNTASFTIPNGFTGSYYVFVWTDRYGYISETEEDNNTAISPIQIVIQLTPPPDLQVTSIITPNNIFSGFDITVNWTVLNTGPGETRSGTWQDFVYFSPNSDLGLGGAILLGIRSHSGNLNVDQSYTESVTGTIPQGIFGTYYVHVITDVYNNEYEHANEGNNTAVSAPITVTLTPPPDLVVSNTTAPTYASNRQTITVGWTVTNEGASTAMENWYDAIYLSPTANNTSLTDAILLGTVSRPNGLDLGDNYSQSLNVQIPDDITGEYFIHVKTDAGESVFEYTFEQNNLAYLPVTDIRTPDLAAENIATPSSGLSGGAILVQWSLANVGIGDLLSRTVKNKITFSTSPNFSSSVHNTLDTTSIITTIVAGASLAQQRQVVLPQGISGQYYLYVHTDHTAEIYENGSNANNYNSIGQPITISLSPWVDLVPIAVTAPSAGTAGGSLALSYTVENSGTAAVQGLTWRDKIYIQNSSVWDPLAARLLHTEIIAQSLQPGESYTKNISVSLPLNLPGGNHYLFVMTDTDNQVYEYTGESNNRLVSTAVAVTGYPPIDLRMDMLTAPSSAMSGQNISVNWAVTNISSYATIAPSWIDAVYISNDAVFSPSTDQLLTTRQQSGPLASNSTYTASRSFSLPNGISGIFYIIAVADHTGLNNDSNMSNNIQVSPAFPITLTPPPDLVIQFMTAPAQAFSGQTIQVYYAVQNNGTGAANGSWTDRIYLSTDLVLNSDDIQVGSIIRSGGLIAGGYYTDTIEANIPLSQFGNRILILKTDDNNAIFEHTMEGNNSASSAISLLLPPPSDLVVSAADAPAMAIAGESVTINWIVKNIGANPAVGTMKEAVYFSLDSIWDVGDALLGTKNTAINLAPNSTASQNLGAELTSVNLGDYYVIVRTDILNNINESNENNNMRVAVPQVTVSVNQLPLNVLTPNVLGANTPLYYRIEIPESLAGETLLVTLKADSLNGANELYLRFGQVPSRSTHDFSFSRPFSGNQEVIVPVLQAGTYYLLAYGATSTGNVQDITLLAEILEFAIRGVHAGQGGNTGDVTLEITGAKFEENMDMILQSGSLAIAADAVQFVDPTKVFARFDLEGTHLGIYDVVAEKLTGETAMLEDGFEIVAGGAPDLAVNVVQPANAAPGQIITIRIEYANNGTNDLTNSIATLQSVGGAPVALLPADLVHENTTLDIELVELGGPPGVLRPGASGVMILYSKALTVLGFTITFSFFE